MTLTAVAEAPAVLVVSAGELGTRSGGLLREVAAGTVVRIDDLRVRRTVGWLVPGPPDGIDPALLPAPGELVDSPGPAA